MDANGAAEAGTSSPLDRGVLKGASQRWDATLDKTLRSALVPYGYTVTTWASGAYLVTMRGRPTAFDVFLFVIGAISAFALLATVAARRSGVSSGELISEEPLPIHPDSNHPIFVAGLHIAATGVAFGTTVLVDKLGALSWFVSPFAMTLVYLSLSSFELAIAIEAHRRELTLRRARRLVRHPRAARRSRVPAGRD